METPKSGITFLRTKDLDETSQFYIDVLGFELALDQGICRIYKICPNCYLGFCLSEGDTGSQEVIITLEIEDVEGLYKTLDNLGVEIEVEPRLNERYNIYQMFVRDPNGYLIEFQKFLDPIWESQR